MSEKKARKHKIVITYLPNLNKLIKKKKETEKNGKYATYRIG